MTTLNAIAELYGALAAVQAELPAIEKTKTAVIKHKDGGGQHSYKYADLADVSAKVMPLLGKHGLAFTAFPEHVDSKFGLSYHLTHSSGAELQGWFEISQAGSIQDVGGRITYARRYILCSVTGVAADEDTDARPSEESEAQAIKQRVNARRKPADPPPLLADYDTPGTVTPQQVTKLQVQFGKLGFGPKDRNDRLALAQRITGRELESSSDLSFNEAARMIKLFDGAGCDWIRLEAELPPVNHAIVPASGVGLTTGAGTTT